MGNGQGIGNVLETRLPAPEDFDAGVTIPLSPHKAAELSNPVDGLAESGRVVGGGAGDKGKERHPLIRE
jgi:hypothetical protein